jgi:hypothetical protein
MQVGNLTLISVGDAALNLELDASNLREMFTTRREPLPFYQHPDTKVIYIEERVYRMLCETVQHVLNEGYARNYWRFMSFVRRFLLEQPVWTDEQRSQQQPPTKRGDRFMHPALPWPQRSDVPEGSLFD